MAFWLEIHISKPSDTFRNDKNRLPKPNAVTIKGMVH